MRIHGLRKKMLPIISVGLPIVLFSISIMLNPIETLTGESTGFLLRNEFSLITQDVNDEDTTIGNRNIKVFSVNQVNNSLVFAEELPNNAVIVKLPDKRVGIKLSDDCSDVRVYKWSNILERNGSFYINVIDENILILSPSKPVDLQQGVNIFFSNVSFSQSINELNKYRVITVFEETPVDPVVNNVIKTVSVNWGDGSVTNVDIDSAEIQHIYKHTGVYPITFVIIDCFGVTYEVTQNYTVSYEGDLVHLYLLMEKYKEPVAAATVSISLTTLAAFVVLTETGKFKFFVFLSLLTPLFTRIQKEDVLDQFVRGEIYGYIKTYPGVTYNEIMRKLELKNGTLSYHLHMLEKMEKIKSRREGIRYRAFYPTGMRYPEEEKYRLTEPQLDILGIIKKNEGITQREIAKRLNKKPQMINYNVKVLARAGLIKIRKKGRKTYCYTLKNVDQNAPP
jgi:predicted transcriptional regulator/nitrogen regulatory protein PII